MRKILRHDSSFRRTVMFTDSISAATMVMMIAFSFVGASLSLCDAFTMVKIKQHTTSLSRVTTTYRQNNVKLSMSFSPIPSSSSSSSSSTITTSKSSPTKIYSTIVDTNDADNTGAMKNQNVFNEPIWWCEFVPFNNLASETIQSITDSFDITFTSTDNDSSQAAAALTSPIPSGQKQLPVLLRIAKALYEESAVWIVSLFLPALMSLVLHSTYPLYHSVCFETAFLLYCTMKLVTKFDKPTRPQKLLDGRNWKYVVDSVWSSQSDLESRRSFLMGWFYDEPFENLRREDALTFLAWMRYGLPLDHVGSHKLRKLEDFDLVELERHVNVGSPLPTRRVDEEALGCMRFNLEGIRYRHKPLLFYAATTASVHWVTQSLKDNFGFVYKEAKDSKTDLGYWYRPAPSNASSSSPPKTTTTRPLVFVHGVGGLAYYFNLLSDLVNVVQDHGDTSPIILIDLPFVSLRMHDDIPSIRSQVKSISDILHETTKEATATTQGRAKTDDDPVKATFVGHSFGSIVLSWMVQSRPDVVANCVFIDPVCFQLHLKNILFNFHYQRVDSKVQKGKSWGNPLSIGGLINLAGTEMHTNNAMLRHFWWASNSLWPQDLVNNNIPSSIILSEKDEIVPSSDVEKMINSFNTKNKNIDKSRHEASSSLVSFEDNNNNKFDVRETNNTKTIWNRFFKNQQCFANTVTTARTSRETIMRNKSNNNNCNSKPIVQVHTLNGACHGEAMLNDSYRSITIKKISEMMRIE